MSSRVHTRDPGSLGVNLNEPGSFTQDDSGGYRPNTASGARRLAARRRRRGRPRLRSRGRHTRLSDRLARLRGILRPRRVSAPFVPAVATRVLANTLARRLDHRRTVIAVHTRPRVPAAIRVLIRRFAHTPLGHLRDARPRVLGLHLDARVSRRRLRAFIFRDQTAIAITRRGVHDIDRSDVARLNRGDARCGNGRSRRARR